MHICVGVDFGAPLVSDTDGSLHPLGCYASCITFSAYSFFFSALYAKFECPVAHQNISFLPTVHDCQTGL